MTNRDLVHEFKNQLSIIVGFCDLLMTTVPPDSQARRDIAQIQRASEAALDLLPELARRLDPDAAGSPAPGDHTVGGVP